MTIINVAPHADPGQPRALAMPAGGRLGMRAARPGALPTSRRVLATIILLIIRLSILTSSIDVRLVVLYMYFQTCVLTTAGARRICMGRG